MGEVLPSLTVLWVMLWLYLYLHCIVDDMLVSSFFLSIFQHDMRSQDQELARTLLALRHDIHQLKLKRSYEEHKEMLDNVKCEMEEVQEMKEVCDLPIDTLENPLKRLGVTPMNISSRRFSIF